MMKQDVIRFGKSKIGMGCPCFIIAEIGANHNRNLATAYKLVDMAAAAGVDAVKFQTLKAQDIAKKDMPADAYGKYGFTRNKKHWSDVLSSIVLPYEWHRELFAYARKKGLVVLSTPESLDAVDLLEQLHVPIYKMASMDITFKPLLAKIAKTGKPVILSAGIATDDDLNRAIAVLRQNKSGPIALLHCVSDYPPAPETLSLNLIPYYRHKFKIPVGFSDHHDSNFHDGLAVAMGACIIEKHITLDKRQKGPDHAFALDKRGLFNLVETVRNAEKSLPVSEALSKRKLAKRKLYGRSIIVIAPKKKGEMLLPPDIDFKRPGTGISPMETSRVIGRAVRRNISANSILSKDDLL